MHFQTGPSDLSAGAPRGEMNISAAEGPHPNNHESTKEGTRRLAEFYLAHWREEHLAAILPTLRRYAVIAPEET